MRITFDVLEISNDKMALHVTVTYDVNVPLNGSKVFVTNFGSC